MLRANWTCGPTFDLSSDEAYCSQRLRAVEESATSCLDRWPVAGAAATELAVPQRAQDRLWRVDAGRRQYAAMEGLLASATLGRPADQLSFGVTSRGSSCGMNPQG